MLQAHIIVSICQWRFNIFTALGPSVACRLGQLQCSSGRVGHVTVKLYLTKAVAVDAMQINKA